VSPDVQEGDCVAQMDEANHVSSILAWAQVFGNILMINTLVHNITAYGVCRK
jgi:hypothetical protein